MALSADNVRRGVTGVVSYGPAGTALPTAVNSSLDAAMVDLGWLSEAGITRTLPGAADREVIRGWQNNGVVIVIRTPSEDNPTFSFVLLETKTEVVEFALGVTITKSTTDGKWTFDGEAERADGVLVIDIVDGAELRRIVVPKAVVTELGDQVYAYGEPIGWEVTVECERDTTTGGHFIEYASALKTGGV